MRRLTFGVLSVMVTLAALTVGLAGQASADASAPALSPAQGPPGTSVTASASDWVGCTSMSVSGWGITLGTASINSSGAFSLPFTVPTGAPLGPAQLQFSPTCSQSTWMPFETFTVTTAPSLSWTSPVGNSGTDYVSSGPVTLAAPFARDRFTVWPFSELVANTSHRQGQRSRTPQHNTARPGRPTCRDHNPLPGRASKQLPAPASIQVAARQREYRQTCRLGDRGGWKPVTDPTIGAQNSPFGWGIVGHDCNRLADQYGGWAFAYASDGW